MAFYAQFLHKQRCLGIAWEEAVLQVGPKRRRLESESDILSAVQRQEVVEATLVQRLTEHVERIDTDMVYSLPAPDAAN
jgi:uncharacterized protein (DUF4213/DUF364 family)